MPNGHSSGFQLSKDALRERLSVVPHAEVVGVRFVMTNHGTYTRQQVTAADVRQLVDEFKGNRIYIEEQDHRWFVLHLDREGYVDAFDGSKWVMVLQESPLHQSLKAGPSAT
jgi:hypothetical protein